MFFRRKSGFVFFSLFSLHSRISCVADTVRRPGHTKSEKCQPWRCSRGRELAFLTGLWQQLGEGQSGGPRGPEGLGRWDVRELVTSGAWPRGQGTCCHERGTREKSGEGGGVRSRRCAWGPAGGGPTGGRGAQQSPLSAAHTFQDTRRAPDAAEKAQHDTHRAFPVHACL